MQLNHPFVISARLLPAVQIGKAFISIEYAGNSLEGRTCYQYHIDTPDFEHTGSDLKSGCQGGGLQEGMESLLCFLGACAESWRYAGKDGENSDLFPPNVAEWAVENSDEIGMLQCEIEETKNLIEE